MKQGIKDCWCTSCLLSNSRPKPRPKRLWGSRSRKSRHMIQRQLRSTNSRQWPRPHILVSRQSRDKEQHLMATALNNVHKRAIKTSVNNHIQLVHCAHVFLHRHHRHHRRHHRQQPTDSECAQDHSSTSNITSHHRLTVISFTADRLPADSANLTPLPSTTSYLVQLKCTVQHDPRVNWSTPCFSITLPCTQR